MKIVKHFGGNTVLDGVSLSVNRGERVALVGANGSGKTTLFRIIAGTENRDSGDVVLGPSAQIGYLGQEGQLEAGRTLYEEMKTLFSQVDELELELRRLEEAMGEVEGQALEKLMNQYSAVQARFDHADPATIDARIHKVTGGLGFSEGDLAKDCGLFSGGWQMRGAMARLLLRAPDCLLLDEPTNHLDLEAMEWLEGYLLTYSGAVLMVSHDRVFLDKVTQRTLELRNGDLEEYAGNYTFYLEEAEKRYQLRLQRYKNQQKKLEQEKRFIERFRYKATLSSRVKSREKMLAKRELEELPDRQMKSMRMSFQEAQGSGSKVVQVKGLGKSYGQQRILEGLNFQVERGDRVALVGANGSGKTTLLKLLAGVEQVDEGKIRLDEFTELVYFAQHQAEALDPAKTILEEVESVAPQSVSQTEVRTLLGCFLFTGDEVNKPVSILSGGEKSRVALTKCVLMPSNLLLLDEPTNHLDIESRESLQSALDLYEGTILFVTHDRALMGHLATKVLDLSALDQTLFDGTYDDFRRAKKNKVQKKISQVQAKKPEPKQDAGTKFQPKVDKAKRTPWKLEALEKKIFSLEERLEEVSAEMAKPENYTKPDVQRQLACEFEELKQKCEELTLIWDDLAEAGS